MPYRAQPYLERSAERCFCEALAVRRCRCCRRPRCADHVARRLCDRCGQAVDRIRPAAASAAWVWGGAVGLVVALALLAAALPLAAPIALGVGPLAGLAAYRSLVARRIRALRPVMATTVGELPAPARDESFPEAPPPATLY